MLAPGVKLRWNEAANPVRGSGSVAHSMRGNRLLVPAAHYEAGGHGERTRSGDTRP